MNILNLPEFEVLDIIQDDHDMTVIVRPVKEPVACPECGGVEYYKHGKSKRFVRDLNSFGKRVGIEIHTHRYKCRYCGTTFSWNDFVGSTKLIEGFGVDIPQLLEVLESDKF